MGYFGGLHTPGGYVINEVTSAMQKAIRRGDVRGALFWATELELAGYGEYVWNRLKIIASEDVGLADPQAVILTRMLYENWSERVAKEKASARAAEREALKDKRRKARPLARESVLYLIHAVWTLAAARKHRGVDHAVMLFYIGSRAAFAPEVPDYALDRHTDRGKRMGRGEKHFLEESSLLENEATEVPDLFKEEGHAWLLGLGGDFSGVDIFAKASAPTAEEVEQLELAEVESSS
jgi:MgsA AAA+ ATPase C terminal